MRIAFEDYWNDFYCVHENELKQSIFDLFKNESEIKFFIDAIEYSDGHRQYDFYTLLLNRLDWRGYSITERLNYSEFQYYKKTFYLHLFYALREEYYDFFVSMKYNFLNDLLR
jgi:hypothetical protein